MPELKYEFVYNIKEFPDIKFGMNGGLTNIDDCIEQLKYLDGVMVDQAVQANPFYKDVDHIFYGQSNIQVNKSDVVKNILIILK